VFTKCGLVWDGDRQVSQSLSAESVRGEVHASLRRLRVDFLDLCQIHWPLPGEQVGEAVATLLDCVSEGLVRYVGVSNFSAAQLSEHAGDPRVVSLQSMYSLVNREADHELFPRAVGLGMGVLVYSTMMSGLLTGAMTEQRIRSLPADDWRRSHPEFTPPRLEQNLHLVQILREVGIGRDASPGEVAVAWVLRQRMVTGAVVGARRPDQVDSFSRAVALAQSDVAFSPIDDHIAGYEAMPDDIHQMAFRGEL
jgi:aryl-alcohol dehydrogenase-like predicted oxidoreductase